LLVRRKKKNLAGQQRDDADSQKHVFQFHGDSVFALSVPNVKQEMKKIEAY
jgi:hypothetical protein